MFRRTYTLRDHSTASRWQCVMGMSAVPLLLNQLKHAETLTDAPLILADHGCSAGYNTMLCFHTVLKDFRKDSIRPVSVIHTEMPGNDWNLFFETVNNSELSHYHLNDTYVLTVSRSPLKQMCPDNTVHVAFSSFAINFYTKQRVPEQSEPALFLKECVGQVISDITVNLKLRIKELVVGGHITICVNARMEQPSPAAAIMFEAVKRLGAKGIIEEEELKHYHWPSYHMSQEEWELILKNVETVAEVKMFETQRSVCPQYLDYLQDGDFEAYRRNLSTNLAVVMRDPLFNCLDRDNEEKEEVFKACQEEIASMIDTSEIFTHFTTVVLQKIAN